MTKKLCRRKFVEAVSKLSGGIYVGLPLLKVANTSYPGQDKSRPNISHGICSGDVSFQRAVVWARSDRAARMHVEIASNEQFQNSRKYVGPEVLKSTDFTGKTLLEDLPEGSNLFYRVRFQDLDRLGKFSDSVSGLLTTASRERTDIRFGWSGDTAGQGFGIDVDRGGMKTYATVANMNLDFFVHSGDVCYADGAFESEKKLGDGSIWKNIVTESTSKVAETIEEFRGNFQYNLLDENVREFNRRIPLFAQWDDHETVNNWYPGEILKDARYSVKSVSLLAARAKQAFLEYMPVRSDRPQRIYRKINRGPLLELFFLDLRSYRSRNSKNDQVKQGPETAFMGSSQLTWLKDQLLSSSSTWKFICSDMPIGLLVKDGGHFENGANGDGEALGRELEIAELLRFMKQQQIRNVVFLTADVHYAASHYYDPNSAIFQDFEPFWEFVSGPLHAGTFGPAEFDNTFGPTQVFCGLPEGMQQNRPPSEGLQFFGVVEIDAESESATVAHYNQAGDRLWEKTLEPFNQ